MCVFLCAGLAVCKEVLEAVVCEGTEAAADLHSKTLLPTRPTPLWDKDNLRDSAASATILTSTQALVLAYLWNMGLFTMDCEVKVFEHLSKCLQSVKGANAQSLIDAVRGAKWCPGKPMKAEIYQCFKGTFVTSA